MIAAAFWTFLAASLAFVGYSGGAEGRRIALACLTATAVTFYLNSSLGFSEARRWVLAVDGALLLVAMTTAATSSRFWPLWFAGFHTVAVASGISSQLLPGVFPRIYSDAAGFWALPALGTAVLGVARDRRRAAST